MGSKNFDGRRQISVDGSERKWLFFPRGHYIPGVTFMRTLRKQVEKHKNVLIFEDFFATRLLTRRGKVVGATAIKYTNW